MDFEALNHNYYDQLRCRNSKVREFLDRAFPSDGSDGDVTASLDLRNQLFPVSLCKYLDIDEPAALIKSLTNFTLWFKSAISQNDPFEVVPELDKSFIDGWARKRLLREISQSTLLNKPRLGVMKKWSLDKLERFVLESSVVTKKEYQDWRRCQNEQVLEKVSDMQRMIFITSLTERFDCSLMWAHYAKQHKGVCLEFDGLEIQKDVLYEHIYPVYYSTSRFLMKCINSDRVTTANTNLLSRDAFKMLLTKSLDWAYEREWRFLDSRPEIIKDNDLENYIIKRSFNLPKNIYLGARFLNVGDGLQRLKDFCDIHCIGLFRMHCHHSEFRLEPSRIN